MRTLLPKTFLLACIVATIQAKIFGRCELARVLKDHGMDGFRGYSLANWVCMAFFESGFDTKAIEKNEDQSQDFGIFQISSDWWCKADIPSENLCYISCNELLNSNIEDDILCAKRIAADPQGMEAWDKWKTHCQHKDLKKWVNGCTF
ncbi:lysozyme C, milk isozyme-like [Hemicordylus capensis]|uniref:lysozyme C, milk isozyme-like n=1 Tax=Hemicordylus capensis TaxID=884348 RepID=UPI0023041E66|nr:lysozyme C, milk isozyme-like [Hemicordylus capensis]XP_053150714.1 lysozyme C, milk isozyme-like [Hemicordylus capensis]XP_053150715.1 lysozyme C, milk isozyme-like [Hemicordylus capensis]XP_053150716.1 lysozyme C, milk isozyme-like [Hemicordylus capensis]XP_053150717.1 lysozyme C, milk isozyme-like [Hemicordylus capensis]XP_053150718.1 lysozyme C, milk isozyme-like [Hemicordylus capensis]XP_053150719.1 lysozyme C, milk isozyme-like [Hemicordylus capensis]XP_053150720.1 lysozyme C, milk 